MLGKDKRGGPSRHTKISPLYILDFVCFEARLIVEVDGGQHSQSPRDAVRDRHFEAQGFKTLRFWNDEVEKNLDGVCFTILHEAGRIGR